MRSDRLVNAMALGVVLGHLLVNAVTPYGVHRDELLYLSMGTHLRFWRMDFPPMIAVLAQLGQFLGAGASVLAIRVLPAVAAGALVLLAGSTARLLGGGTGAQRLAALCVVASPLFLRAGNLFQPVIFDQLWWTLALYLLVRIGTRGEDGLAPGSHRDWILLGVVMGLGLLTKFSIAFIGLGIAVALLLTPMRRALATRWPWVAVALALVIGSASVVGQVRLGFPVVGQMAELRSSQLAYVGMLDFVAQQFLYGPQTLVAAFGAVWLLRDPAGRAGRTAGLAAVATFLLLLLLRGKSYYIGPIYPVLFGAGAVALARVAARAGQRTGRVVMAAAAAACALWGAVLLPIGVPILAPPTMERYVAALGLTPALRNNQGQLERLPQDYADMLPWKAQAETVARVFGILSPADREQVVIGAANYGEAGALDLYGPRLGLPPVVSGAGSFWFFGPGTRPGKVAIILGGTVEALTPLFDSLEVAATVREPFAVAEEQAVPVFIARRPRATLQQAWPMLKP